jgi:hypothetical protein
MMAGWEFAAKVVMAEIKAKKISERQEKASKLSVLKLAYEYEAWLQRNGVGSSYSTFCDEFGVEADHRPVLFAVIEDVRKYALAAVQNRIEFKTMSKPVRTRRGR